MKTKKVFSLGLAKSLLALGYVIVGIEYNKFQNKQVYVFKVEGDFEKDFSKVKEEFEIHLNKLSPICAMNK